MTNSTGHKLGYARVSTSEQDLRMQREALISAGVDPRDIFEEKISGASLKKRRQFHNMMRDIEPGDTVYVWKLDRLARNMRDLYETAEQIRLKGARLHVITMPGMDTDTPVGKVIFGIMAIFAEFERAIALERTLAGLKAAREAGRFGGNKSKFTDEQVLEIRHLRPSEAARRLGMSHAGYMRRLNVALKNKEKSTP